MTRLSDLMHMAIAGLILCAAAYAVLGPMMDWEGTHAKQRNEFLLHGR